jgi:hypothetical protein
MNELVERRAARAGTDAAVARTIVGTIPGFQRKEGPADKAQSLMGTKAGAKNAVKRARPLPEHRTCADSHQATSSF